MARYLINAQLPYRFSLWNTDSYIHVYDLDDEMTDSEIGQYAQQHSLIIVTKDADFSDRALVSKTSPKVIHLKIGNMKLRDLYTFLDEKWSSICEMSRKKTRSSMFSRIGSKESSDSILTSAQMKFRRMQ